MKRIRQPFAAILILTAMVLGVAASVDAQRRNEREIRDSIRILNSKIEDFENNLRDQMQRSSANNNRVNDVMDEVRSLRDSLQQFESKFESRRENRTDVDRVVSDARRVDEFLKTDPQNRFVTDDWAAVLRQIDRLCSNYGFTTDWGNGDEAQNVKDQPDTQPVNNVSNILSGTYQFDTAKSERVEDIITDTSLTAEQRDDLKDKLTAPDQIAIDVRGNRVTLATSNASPITFVADGSEKTEQSGSGKTIRLRSTLSGDVLTMSSLGGDSDYTITFTSIDRGQTLKVMRRFTTEYTSQTIFAESVYNKTDQIARLGIDTTQPNGNGTGSGNNNGNINTDPNGGYSDNDQNNGVTNGGSNGGQSGGQQNGRNSGRVPNNPPRNSPPKVTNRPGNYIVPNGTVLAGTLDNEVNSKVSQNNDRFRMTVTSPSEYRGATIEGYISGISRSGKIAGQASVTFNFERITLADGKTYDFAGNLQAITDTSGKVIRIDNESSARGDNQGKQTVTRSGMGAGLGALIGLIAGGGKGAAIGAIIGGGAGAGSSIITAKQSDVQIHQGSSISVQSSSPLNRNQQKDH